MMKKTRHYYTKLQVGKTTSGETHRLLLPIVLQRKLSEALNRDFQQGEDWEIQLLEGTKGYYISPVE